MRAFFLTIAVLAVSALLPGCATTGSSHSGASAAAHRAHDNFVAAINSNELDTFLAMLTEDAVFMPPGAPRLIGKPAIRYWAQEYLDAYRTHWVKTTLEFVVLDGWAFEQYSFESTDTPRAGGEVVRDTGKGIIIYRLDNDGVWRVARDAWNSDHAPAH